MVDLLQVLLDAGQDPWVYLPLFFGFAVAATVILPIPVELGLLNPWVSPFALVVILGLGKAVGTLLVLPLGSYVGERAEREFRRYPRLDRLYARVRRWVARWGYLALFAILSIPFMTDTVPLYAFSTMARRPGHARPTGPLPDSAAVPDLRWPTFVAVAFGSGIVRGSIFLAIPLSLGWP